MRVAATSARRKRPGRRGVVPAATCALLLGYRVCPSPHGRGAPPAAFVMDGECSVCWQSAASARCLGSKTAQMSGLAHGLAAGGPSQFAGFQADVGRTGYGCTVEYD